jgi:hypothetical protein
MIFYMYCLPEKWLAQCGGSRPDPFFLSDPPRQFDKKGAAEMEGIK